MIVTARSAGERIINERSAIEHASGSIAGNLTEVGLIAQTDLSR
jgi:hypothetical protein